VHTHAYIHTYMYMYMYIICMYVCIYVYSHAPRHKQVSERGIRKRTQQVISFQKTRGRRPLTADQFTDKPLQEVSWSLACACSALDAVANHGIEPGNCACAIPILRSKLVRKATSIRGVQQAHCFGFSCRKGQGVMSWKGTIVVRQIYVGMHACIHTYSQTYRQTYRQTGCMRARAHASAPQFNACFCVFVCLRIHTLWLCFKVLQNSVVHKSNIATIG
jgi:hypothetical protein